MATGPKLSVLHDDDHPFTIEQLALESGLSVRNIRSHQARGLLPAPVVRRRVGYYGREHLQRLRVIGELQAQGLHLKAVKQVLDDAEGAIERLLSLRRSISEPVALEQSQVLTETELQEQLGGSVGQSPKLTGKLQELGFVVSIGADHYEIPSPSLLSAMGEARERGLSDHHVAELVDSLQRHTEAVARRLVKSFVDDVWKPFLHERSAQENWPEVTEAIARLPPLGTQALSAVFAHTVSRHIEATLGDAAKQLSERKR